MGRKAAVVEAVVTLGGASVVDEKPVEPVKSVQRQRETEHALCCEKCGANAAFVTHTLRRTHPEFVEIRRRRYACRECGHSFFVAK